MWRPNIIIAAAGALQAVPYAMLPHPTTGRMLVEANQITITPSISILLAIRRTRISSAKASGVAVFADPIYSSDDPRLRSQTRATHSQFERLVYSGREAERIRAIAPSQVRVFSGAAANLDALVGIKAANTRILHLAAHGQLDSSHPDMSALVLSLLDENGAPREGFLRTRDIPAYGLKPDLVVIDSCRSAMGTAVPGEGLAGLTESFLAAGAARVLASVWSVDDEASSLLMHEFYREMLGPEATTPAAALRKAQYALARSRRYWHPYYWSGFVLSGEYR